MTIWTEQEVDHIVNDYFSMLFNELAGKPFSKTDHRNNLTRLLNNRTKGSIEYKHQNISAILNKRYDHYLKGYKPAGNYQKLLEERVLHYVQNNQIMLENNLLHFATIAIEQLPKVDFNNLLVEPPVFQPTTQVEEDGVNYRTGRGFKINYLEREQRNASLGEKGEIIAE